MNDEFLKRMRVAFPGFAAKLGDGTSFELENVQAPWSEDDLHEMEISVGLTLPESYKAFLQCGREFWLFGGVVQFHYPFFHKFESLDKLTSLQQRRVREKGDQWPPPSEGMLCFAEFFMESDGDQVLFDVSGGMVSGEYPVMYYDHEAGPPSVRRLANTFPEFLTSFLDYPAFARED